MDNKQKKVVSAIVKDFQKKNKRNPKDDKELAQFVQSQGGDKYIKRKTQEILGGEQTQEQTTEQKQKALHGAKLNYFKTLKHQCAEDEEVVYYKKGGGFVDCGCKKKDGGEVTKAKKGTVVDEFKNRKPVPNLPTQEKNPGSTKQPMLDALKRKYHKNDYSSKTVKESQKDYDKGKGDHEVKKCGGKVKRDCGGSKLKACNGAVAKFKIHRQGGSLNGIPFYQGGTPKAGIRYKGGKKDSFENENHENVDVIMGQKPNFYTHAPLISRIISSDGNDTTFVEVPEHTSFTTVKPRVAKNNWVEDLNNKKIYSNSPEYYTMRRRFSEASLASPGKFKIFVPKPYTPLKYTFGN